MNNYDYLRQFVSDDELAHSGIKGMKWYRRRYQNMDGSLTLAGRRHYGVGAPREKGSIASKTKIDTSDEGIAKRKYANSREAALESYVKKYNEKYNNPNDRKLSFEEKAKYESENESIKGKWDTSDAAIMLRQEAEAKAKSDAEFEAKVKEAEGRYNPNENQNDGKKNYGLIDNAKEIKETVKNAKEAAKEEAKSILESKSGKDKSSKKNDSSEVSTKELAKKIRKEEADNAGYASKAFKAGTTGLNELSSLVKTAGTPAQRNFDTSHMTDQELQARVNRLNLEASYDRLMSAATYKKNGADKVADLLSGAAKLATVGASVMTIVKNVKSFGTEYTDKDD